VRTIRLAGAAAKVESVIGVDYGPPPQAGPAQAALSTQPPAPPILGSVVFGAWVDGKKVFESGVMKRGDAPQPVSLDLVGAKTLVLAVIDANDGTAGDSADWPALRLSRSQAARRRSRLPRRRAKQRRRSRRAARPLRRSTI